MHRWAPDRSARHSTSHAAAASLLLSIALVSGGAAALTASAAAEVTADRGPKAGETARVPLVIESDIDYGSVSTECEFGACLLDLYKTDGGGAKEPLIVLIHGGGWIHGQYCQQGSATDHKSGEGPGLGRVCRARHRLPRG